MKEGDIVWTYRSSVDKADRSVPCRIVAVPPTEYGTTLYELAYADGEWRPSATVYRAADEISTTTTTTTTTPDGPAGPAPGSAYDYSCDCSVPGCPHHDTRPTITAHDLTEILADYPGHATISAVEVIAPGHVQIIIIRPTDGETRTENVYREQNPPKGYAARWSTHR